MTTSKQGRSVQLGSNHYDVDSGSVIASPLRPDSIETAFRFQDIRAELTRRRIRAWRTETKTVRFAGP